MGRPRKNRLDLPERVYFESGRYRFKPKDGAAVELGTEHGPAMSAWGKLIDLSAKTAKTMGEWGDLYTLEIAPKKAPRTRLDNAKEWKNLRPAFGHLLPSEVTPQLMYKYMAARGARTRANREKALLSHMLTYCVFKGAIPVNPLFNAMRRDMAGTSERPRDRNVVDKEMSVFRSVSSAMITDYCDVKEATGLRKGDILTLRVPDLTDDGIQVMPRKGRRRDPETGERVGKRRLFRWTPALRATFERILTRRKLLLKRAKKVSPYVFVTRGGESYYNELASRSDGFDSIWKRYMTKAVKAAEVAGWTMPRFTEHDIRARAGTEAERVQPGRGHKLLGNTAQLFDTTYNRGVEVVTPLEKP